MIGRKRQFVIMLLLTMVVDKPGSLTLVYYNMSMCQYASLIVLITAEKLSYGHGCFSTSDDCVFRLQLIFHVTKSFVWISECVTKKEFGFLFPSFNGNCLCTCQ